MSTNRHTVNTLRVIAPKMKIMFAVLVVLAVFLVVADASQSEPGGEVIVKILRREDVQPPPAFSGSVFDSVLKQIEEEWFKGKQQASNTKDRVPDRQNETEDGIE